MCRQIVRRAYLVLWIGLILASPLQAASRSEPPPPADDDYSAGSLRKYQAAVLATHGGDYRQMPLSEKAEHFFWVIEKYHTAPTHQVHFKVTLPDRAGKPPFYGWGADTSTWNGSLLAALSYKYAVTQDPHTLKFITRLLRGLHFFQQVTEYPGLAARSVLRRDTPVVNNKLKYTAPDGTVYYYRSDPAKGTYNQLMAGYATLMLLAYDDLPPLSKKMAVNDLSALAGHLVEHDYHLTEKDGERTPYGNLTPLVGRQGVPFNAQVAYTIVATAQHFMPADHPQRKKIEKEFHRLRNKHHAYYSAPLKSLIHPQRVGASPLVKGMNDRNHVTNASYISLMLDLHQSARDQTPMDRTFVYRMGRTMFHSLQKIEQENNSLCNFMYCGLLSNRAVFDNMIKPNERERTFQQLNYLLYSGIEQLRRFPLERFSCEGVAIPVDYPIWADEAKPNSAFLWKNNSRELWKQTAPHNNQTTSHIDYLYAYWLMRYYRLDEHPAALYWHADILR